MSKSGVYMISIAMTTYNGSKYISEQLESILNQTITDYELIICDDCSTDNTIEIINEFQKKDSRIKLYHNEQNLGFKKNFERAIKLCTGDYIALCDQDDVWTENHLEVLLNNIGDNLLCCGNNELVNQNLESLHIDFFTSNNFSLNKYPCNLDILKKMLLSGNCFQGASMLFHKDIIKFYLPLPDEIKYHDSWLSALACAINKFSVTETIITKYRQHEAQVTSSDKSNAGFYKDRIIFCEKLLNRTPSDFSLYEKEIIQIKNYFTNILSLKGKFKELSYWNENYIYIHPDANKLKKILRLVKLFIVKN